MSLVFVVRRETWQKKIGVIEDRNGFYYYDFEQKTYYRCIKSVRIQTRNHGLPGASLGCFQASDTSILQALGVEFV